MSADLLEQILPHIEASIYPFTLSVPDWKYKEAHPKESLASVVQEYKGTLIRIPFEWGKSQKRCWFKQLVRIPESFANAEVVLRTDITQGIAWVDGELRQTLTPQQSEIPLTSSAKASQEFLVSILAEPDPAQEVQIFSKAELVVVDSTARRLYNSLTVLREVEDTFEPQTPEAKELKELIRRTLVFLKYFKPGSEEYPNAIKRAYAFLVKTLETECKATIPATFHLALLGEEKATVLSSSSDNILTLCKQMAPTIHLMRSNPTVCLSHVGTHYYQQLQQHAPRTLHTIKEFVAEKRWELIGNASTVTDIFLHTGETFLRRLLEERHTFQRLLEKTPEIFFLPASCGSFTALPQILQHFGYKALLTTSSTTSAASSAFLWKGTDGTRLLTASVPLPLNVEVGSKDFLSEIELLAENLPSDNGYFLQVLDPSTLAPSQIEKIHTLRSLAGLPAITTGSLEQFFEAIRSKDEQSFTEKVTFGERCFFHKIPYQLLATITQYETLLTQTDSVTATLLAISGNTPKTTHLIKRLQERWKFLVQPTLNAFIEGTATPEFYTAFQKQYTTIYTEMQKELRQALAFRGKAGRKKDKSIAYSVFNPLPWTRSGYTTLTIRNRNRDTGAVVKDEFGNLVETQLLSADHEQVALLCYLKDIPPLSSRNLNITFEEKKPTKETPWEASSRSIETPWYKIRLDKNGAITSLYAKHLRREMVAKGKKWNFISVLRESSKTDKKSGEETIGYIPVEANLKSIKIGETGHLRLKLGFEYRTQNQSSFHVDLILYHASPRIDFQVRLHCKERHTRIEATFPLNINPKTLLFPLPFGSEVLPLTNKEKGVTTTGMWATAAEGGIGIHCLTSIPTEISFQRNTFSLKLLQTETIPRHSKTTSDIDCSYYNIGEYAVSYALFPFKGTTHVWETHRTTEEFRTDLLLLPETTLAMKEPPLFFTKNSVVVTAFSPAENGDHILLRCYESEGEPVETGIRFGFKVGKVTECTLAGDPLKEVASKKNQYILRLKPHEIKTLRIDLPKSKKKKRI